MFLQGCKIYPKIINSFEIVIALTTFAPASKIKKTKLVT